ncbi:TPA: hypothetical protein ACQUNC_005866 [Bacillus paranthracis]
MTDQTEVRLEKHLYIQLVNQGYNTAVKIPEYNTLQANFRN